MRRRETSVAQRGSALAVLEAFMSQGRGLRHHLIADHPNRLDLNFYDIPCVQEQGWLAPGANPGWRPGRDQIAGFQRHEGTEKGNRGGNGENHLGGGFSLDHLAIHSRGEG